MSTLPRPELDLEEFLALLSHELRTPAQNIGTNAWLIKSRTTDEQLVRPAEAIERQVARLSKILDDLTDLMRVSRHVDLALQPESVQKMVTAAVVATQASVHAQRRELAVEMSGERLCVNADAARLEQAVRNLLHNAVKYSSQQQQILVSVRREDASAAIHVSDHGAGIAPEDLPRVFDMHARRRGDKRPPEGIGIGLSIARSVVEAHGGTIEARSAGLGRGAEFIVRLPLVEAASEARDVEGEDLADTHGAPLAILVADDNHDAADSLAELLHAQGHEARAAYGGEEAIRLARERSYDVALLDIGMPVVDGLEVARRISHSPHGAHTLLVAITGWGASADRERSRQAGFAYHLTKPVDYDTLGALLATAARRREGPRTSA